jgi:biofilm PGA synthesis N-glycosyltransferase PgaC
MDIPIYVLITPARNEARHLEKTINSVVKQTARPLRWVIVSDGSTDGTDEIVSKYADQHSWIELVSLPEHAQRNFAGKVAAFNAGYARVTGLKFDVIGNLDGDVSFDEDYLEFLISKFADNPRLGVAGTPYLEENAIHDERFKSPDHVSGACQMFRRECFEEIGGYQPLRSGGIDLVALLAAQAKGWQTKRYDEKFCLHHRNVGSGDHAGIYARLLNRGRKDYLLGSHPAFEIFRSLNQMKTRPYIVGGVLMLVGYFWAMLLRVERSMPLELMHLRQHDQMHRLKEVLRHPLTHNGGRSPRPVTVRGLIPPQTDNSAVSRGDSQAPINR